MAMNLTIKAFIKYMQRTLKLEQKKMLNKADYYENAQKILFEDEGLNKSNSELPGYMMDALREIEKLDLDKIFNSPRFKAVLAKFEKKLQNIMMNLRFDLLSKLDDPTFFYKRNVAYKVVKWALGFAASRLSSIPILNMASYIIVEAEKAIREARVYHQNMLLYYLNSFPAEELGLTKEEADHAFSSIYESRISWFNIWDSRSAQKYWDRFGTDRFYTSFRAANNKLRKAKKLYTYVGNRLNYAFQDVTYKDSEVVVNLFDNESMFQGMPAVTHYYKSPLRVAIKRQLLQIVQVGISFVPVPSFIKKIVNSYVDSTYVSQSLTEGALTAYFESIKNKEMQNKILRQSVNPFVQ